MSVPFVSVKVITYNHEKFIAQCLEGILMQRTNFSFEVIVGEDCSTDRTREIVFDYQAKFPDKIRVITSEKNVGGMANVIRVQQACQGKYQASCEGDDYWIDPLKLQRQADFMEAHPEVSMCFHNVLTINENRTYARLFYDSPTPEFLDFDAACQIIVPMSSVMARSEVLATLPGWRKSLRFGDVIMRLWCAHSGKLGFLNEVMSVYRKHAGGMTKVVPSRARDRQEEIISIYRRFDDETRGEHASAIQTKIFAMKKIHNRENIGWVYFLFHPRQLIHRLGKYWRIISAEKQLW